MAGCIRPSALRLPGLLVLLAAAWPAAAQRCPAAFDEFLERFETDRKFHERAVRFPLRMAYLDWVGDRAVKHHGRLSRREYVMPRQPWYPSRELQDEWRLAREVRDQGKTRRIVRFEQADAEGYKAEFHFQRVSGCWRLVFMDDQSL